MKLAEFLTGVGQSIPFHSGFARVFGVKAAVLLCGFISCHEKQAADADGWIQKTQTELLNETGMSAKEQATARKTLKSAGVIEEHLDRLNHRQFYRVNFDALELAVNNRGQVPTTQHGTA